MPVTLNKKPEEDSGTDPQWYRRESDPLEDAFDAPAATDDDLPAGHPSKSTAPASNRELAQAESTPTTSANSGSASDQQESSELNGFFNPKDGKRRLRGNIFASKRNRWIGAGVGGSIVGIGMFGFFLLPLKVMHIAENLQDTFFSSAEDASEHMTDRLLADYLIKHVMPGMTGTCKSTLTVNKSCAVVPEDANNPVALLYGTWRDQNLEGQLGKKYGLEIRREGGKYYVRKGGHDLFSGVERTDTNQKLFEDKMFAEMDRKDVRKEFHKAIENETFYKRIMYRFKYGAFIQRKYGVVRCVIACDYRNDRADRKELRKLRFQFWFIDRISGPRTEMYATAFKCALGGFECTKPDSFDTGVDGDRRSQLERDVRASVGTAIGDGRYSQEKLDSAKKRAEGIRNKGVSGQLVEELVGKLTSESVGKVAGSSLPVVGWIDSAVRIFQGVKDAGPALKTMNYVINSQAYVQLYTMYRSNADEIKDGRILAEDAGYVGESLGDNYGTDQNGGGAETSPYYQDIMGTRSATTASLFPKAEATGGYKCNDGKTVITRGLCPEMSLSTVSGAAKIAGGASDFLNSGPLAPVGVAADVWSNTISSAFDVVGGILGSWADNLVPGAIKDKAGEIIASVGQWFISKVINDALGFSPSGGRMFDIGAMGANVAGNDYAHYGQGAGKISNEDANKLRTKRAAAEQEEFSHKSFFARMFDTSSSYSMVSRLALSSPAGADMTRSLATSFLNPFSTVSTSLPIGKKVSAKPIQNLDLGGVTQYGYASNDPVFKQTDYVSYWKDNDCGNPDKLKAWAESAKISDETGMPVNDSPNPCKLVESVALSNCGYYNDDCLTPEELGTADENACKLDNGVSVAGMPSWVKMPVVNATPGGKVTSTVHMAIANIQQHPDVGPGVHKLATGYNLDFIGLNEVGDTSLQEIESASNNQFGAYRDPHIEGTGANGGGARSLDNVVMWRKDKWNFVDGGRVKITEDDKTFYNGDERIWDRWATWAVFKNPKTGEVVPVVVAHAMTNPAKFPRQWGDPPMTRIQQYALSMNILTNLVSILSQYGPVMVAGDMNAQYDRGDWSAVPKMQAAGFDYVSDGAVVYIFHPKGTKASNVRIDSSVKTPHDSHKGAVIADFDMNGAGPGGVTSSGALATSADGSCDQASSVDYKNPVYSDGSTADPSVIRDDSGTYHLFATADVHLTSKDLVNWKKEDKGWNLQGEPALPGTGRWGPNVVKIGSKYVLTFVYAIGLPETGGYGASRIAYAVADNISGPYQYKAVLNLPGNGLEIAPQIYVEGNKSWLVWGGGFFDIMEVRLDGDQLKTIGESKHLLTKGGVGSPNATIESPWISKHDGWYYLTYSQGHWNVKDGPPNYRVLVTRSRTVTGPYAPDNSMKPILESKDPIHNPGSHTIATDDAGNDWIVYGAFFGNDRSGRKLMIDSIYYENGWLSVNGPTSTTRKGPMIGDLEQATSASFVWPVSKADYVPLSNCYAKPHGSQDGHTGIDIPVNNKPVLAAADGIVVASGGPSGDGGNYLIIQHSNGKWTNYQHLSSKKASVGNRVKQGDEIGISGNTGNTTGPHLHFGITNQKGLDKRSAVAISVNPLDFLSKDRDLGKCQ